MPDELEFNGSETDGSSTDASTSPNPETVTPTNTSLSRGEIEQLLAQEREQYRALLEQQRIEHATELERVRSEALSIADRKRNEAMRGAKILEATQGDFEAEGVPAEVVGRVAQRFINRTFYSGEEPPKPPAPAADAHTQQLKAYVEGEMTRILSEAGIAATDPEYAVVARQYSGDPATAIQQFQSAVSSAKQAKQARVGSKPAPPAPSGGTPGAQTPLPRVDMGGGASASGKKTAADVQRELDQLLAKDPPSDNVGYNAYYKRADQLEQQLKELGAWD